MKKVFLSIFLTSITMMSTACGTISPQVQTQTETSVTEPVESVTDSAASAEAADNSEEEQIKSNTFIAEFFDSNIMFADVQNLVSESMKSCTFENQTDASSGIQKISLKSANGGGILNVMCIDLSQSSLSYDLEYILENFGNYYFGLTAAVFFKING